MQPALARAAIGARILESVADLRRSEAAALPWQRSNRGAGTSLFGTIRMRRPDLVPDGA